METWTTSDKLDGVHDGMLLATYIGRRLRSRGIFRQGSDDAEVFDSRLEILDCLVLHVWVDDDIDWSLCARMVPETIHKEKDNDDDDDGTAIAKL